MSETIRLEYACTPAEFEEAQKVHLQKEVGKGSKWRTTAIVYIVLGFVALGLFFRIRHEIDPAHQPYFFAGVIVLYIGLCFWNKRKRAEPQPIQVYLSEDDVQIVASGSRTTSRWSAFSDCMESPNLFVVVDRSKTILLMFPKRAFPSIDSQEWFRGFIHNKLKEKPAATQPIVAPVLSKDQVTLTFKLGYRDYLDRALASWFTWGFILGIWTIITCATLFSEAPPNPVNSTAKVFFVFIIPFMFVVGAMITLIFSIQPWLAHKALLIPQKVALSESSIGLGSADGTSNLPWTDYKNYKETRRSFIIWNGRQSWMLLPKRTFTSSDDLQRSRTILAANLHSSRWFLG